MKMVKFLGTVLTGIGAILIGIVGIIAITGNEVDETVYGVTLLVLGIGLLLVALVMMMGKKE